MSIEVLLKACQQEVDQALKRYLPQITEKPAHFNEALHYVLFNGGKRLRPLLVLASGKAVGTPKHSLLPLACCVEIIHCYSLVHDDLPAMDNDDLRRGKPTCHKAFDEATAILVGDGLQALAFEIISSDELTVSSEQQLNMIQLFSRAIGLNGMVKGQALDIATHNIPLNLSELESLHHFKTGCLIEASVLLGAKTNENLPAESMQKLQSYAKAIGLAFQIQDDILDIISDTKTLGKTQGKDQAQNKTTYPSLIGIESAKIRATELVNDALSYLDDFDHQANNLREIAKYIVERIY